MQIDLSLEQEWARCGQTCNNCCTPCPCKQCFKRNTDNWQPASGSPEVSPPPPFQMDFTVSMSFAGLQ